MHVCIVVGSVLCCSDGSTRLVSSYLPNKPEKKKELVCFFFFFTFFCVCVQVPWILRSLVTHLCVEKPERPVKFMIEHLQRHYLPAETERYHTENFYGTARPTPLLLHPSFFFPVVCSWFLLSFFFFFFFFV